MKLVTKTSLNFFSAAVFMFLGGSILFYFIIRTTINNNLNEELLSVKNQYSKELNYYHSLPSKPDLNVLKSIISPLKAGQDIEDQYSDTIFYNNIDGNYYLYRQLKFSIYIQDKLFLIQLFKPQNNSDKLIADLAIFMAVAAIIFMISLYLLNRYTIKKSWFTFYKTIDKIKSFDMNKGDKLVFDNAEIIEFQQLNDVISDMTNKINQDFENLKEYTENTSHEIQTPLAIINSKAELLLQSENLTEHQLGQISTIYEASNRLSKLNESLIYLAKLDKRQFVELSDVNIGEIVNRNVQFFSDYINAKNISLSKQVDNNVIIKLNKELTDTLIQNLLKNAIKHNIKNGSIDIELNKKHFKISNTGYYKAENTEHFFKRYKKSNPYTKSPGIGLSIVKRICEIFSMKIEYKAIEKQHIITVNFNLIK